MKIKKGFELRDICGEKVVIASGIENLNFDKLISLNDSAAYLFAKVQGLPQFETEDLVELLLAEYEVGREQAAADAAELVKSWTEQGLVEA